MKDLKLGSISLFISALLLTILTTAPAAAAPGQYAPIASRESTLQQYKEWIKEARATYPYRDSADKMYRVMMCESVGDPRAVGGRGRWHGLFQYVPSTWRQSWNPYRQSDIYDARAQIFATAKAWSIGMQNHWTCYKLTR